MPNNREGYCCICGLYGKLSKEHIPPQSAFNDKTAFLRVFKEQNYGQSEDLMRRQQHQGGVHRYVMCGKCNNDIGGRYARAYVDFCYNVYTAASSVLEGKTLTLLVPQVYPLRVLKHVLVMFCATCGHRFVEKKGGFLRELIMDPRKRNVYFPDTLYLYIRSRFEGIASTGPIGMLHPDTGRVQAGAEVSWWPAGWHLAFQRNEVPFNGLNVNWWLEYEYDEKVDLLIQVPCRPATELPYLS